MSFKSMKILSLVIGAVILGFELFIQHHVTPQNYPSLDILMLGISVTSIMECFLALALCQEFDKCFLETLWRFTWFLLYLTSGIFVICQSSSQNLIDTCELLESYPKKTICPYLKIRLSIGSLAIISGMAYAFAVPKSKAIRIVSTRNNNSSARIRGRTSRNSLVFRVNVEPAHVPAPGFRFLTNDLTHSARGLHYDAPPPYSALSVPMELNTAGKVKNCNVRQQTSPV